MQLIHPKMSKASSAPPSRRWLWLVHVFLVITAMLGSVSGALAHSDGPRISLRPVHASGQINTEHVAAVPAAAWLADADDRCDPVREPGAKGNCCFVGGCGTSLAAAFDNGLTSLERAGPVRLRIATAAVTGRGVAPPLHPPKHV